MRSFILALYIFMSILSKFHMKHNLRQRFGTSKTHLSPLVAEAAVRSKAVVLLLLICCLMCFPLGVGVLCLSLFCCALLCVLSSFEIILKSWLLCFYCLTDVLLL